MAKVGLERMEFYAFHGYYDFERRIGNRFILDVIVDIDIINDPDERISNTFNYEIIYEVCKRLMKRRYRLLESLAHDIGAELRNQEHSINGVMVRIEKINPGMGGKIGKAVVEFNL
jgi:dihydroneopterin aldolase